jgi:hypothetical protein
MAAPAMMICLPVIFAVMLAGLALVSIWWTVETFIRWFFREFTTAMEKSPGD